MIFVDQVIPAELQAMYSKLITASTLRADTKRQARTTKRARAGSRKKKPKTQVNEITQAVDALIEFLTIKNNAAPAASFRTEQIKQLKIGNFAEEYWQKCTIETEQVLINEPTFNIFVGARNYAYPDPTNQPTVPIYGLGNVSAAPLQYIGYTAGTEYRDVSLKWIRIIFKLKNEFLREKVEPIFLKLQGSVTASADARASRAMLSAIVKRWLVTQTSIRLTTLEPPTSKPLSFLYRYQVPRGEAPYYNKTSPLRIVKSMRSEKYEETPDMITHCVVLAAPMPMMGKRFNNNTSINTTLAATIELWQIRKTEPAFYSSPRPYLSPDGLTWSSPLADDYATAGNLAQYSIGKSVGKWYWELYIPHNGAAMFGVSVDGLPLADTFLGLYLDQWGIWLENIGFGTPGYSITAYDYYFADYAAKPDGFVTIGIKLDMDNGTMEFLTNNVSDGIAFTGIAGTVYPIIGAIDAYPGATNATTEIVANMSSSSLIYAIPTGYAVLI